MLDVYRITRAFPREEQFGLTSQLRRAAVSFTSNIAEGFSRVSRREKVQFYTVALGSLTEIQNQLLIARDIGYLSKDQFGSIASQTVEAHKITRGLVRSIRP